MCCTDTVKNYMKQQPKKDKIAILGGTFNPPHNGHLHLLKAFENAMDFDKILIIPAAIPPHKEAPDLAAPEHRLNMCKLAFPTAEVCDIEIKNGGKNYTADTLEQLKEIYPDAQFYFIMGTDMLNTWRDPQRILKNAILLCDARDDTTSVRELRNFAKLMLGLREEQFIISDVQPLPLSSTEVREKCRRGESIADLVPPAVAEYIQKERLYER